MALAVLCSCTTTSKPKGDQIVVSVDDQRLVLLDKGQPVKSYPVSTSKFGTGSQSRSNKTPLGKMYVHQKIGGGARPGAVFKSRRQTGEVLRPNTPGRDPIVSRILWLEGVERANSNTKERFIYIHGTPEEHAIGKPVSYGCIRMTSKDVIDLYDRVTPGTGVYVKRTELAMREIPATDRMMVAASRSQGTSRPTRYSPVRISQPPRSIENRLPEVFAAAEPAKSKTQKRPPATTPPVRRGAFTKMPTTATVPARPVYGPTRASVAFR